MPVNKELKQWRLEQKRHWAELPSGPFGTSELSSLTMFSMRKVTGSFDNTTYPTVYLPSARWEDFLVGQSHEDTNPLDPHGCSYVVDKVHATQVGKARRVSHTCPKPFMRSWKCRFCPAYFTIGPEVDDGFELKWKNWVHCHHCTSACLKHANWDWEDANHMPCPTHKAKTPGKKDIYGNKPSSISQMCKDFMYKELVKFPNTKSSALRDAWTTFFKNLIPPPLVGPGRNTTYVRRDDYPTVQDVNNVRQKVKEDSHIHHDQAVAMELFAAQNPTKVPFFQDHVTTPCSDAGCSNLATHSVNETSEDVKCNTHAPTGQPSKPKPLCTGAYPGFCPHPPLPIPV